MKNLKSTHMQDHLSKSVREFLNSCNDPDNKRRIYQIQCETWIGYPSAKLIIDRIESLIEMPRITRMHSLLVIGTTDNGKSSIRKRIQSKHEHFATPNGKVHFPVISIQMPPNPDERSFYNNLLKAMLQPQHLTGKVDHIRESLINTLEELNVKLIMIDEVQHIDRMPIRKQRTMLDSIKYISNELSLPIVAFGTEEAVNVFAADPQLNNRFKKVYLTKWELDEHFVRLLKSYEQLIPLKEPSKLYDEELATYIFTKTNGTIGEVNTLIRDSAVAAVKSGREKITKDIIDSINFISSNSAL